jgi:uncharacterized protein YchJ
LFSDKTCAFPHTGNVKLDWSRWFRDCIAESAKQLRGAERWLRTNPKRIFLDSKCMQPFPLSLDQIANAKVHRVIVALGAQERCKQLWGGSGSLRIVPAITGKAHHDLKNCDVQPFTVGSLSDDSGHFHILDDFTLPLLLKELDTITDFVSYLEFKEALLRANKVEMIAGEENLLALFLRRYLGSRDWQAALEKPHDEAELKIKDGPWRRFTETSLYLQARKALEQSYLWDGIIRQFAAHAFEGTLVPGSPESVAENEQVLRAMAQEPRWARGFLALKMIDRWANFAKDRVDYRIVESPTLAGTAYVFVFVPKSSEAALTYREDRQEYLHSYCWLVATKHPEYDRIYGIASEAGDEPYRTFDILAVEGKWSPQLESIAAEIRKELDVTGGGHVHRFKEELAAFQAVEALKKTSLRAHRRLDGKIGRNDLCPCGSGKKYKRCCLPRRRTDI